MEKNVPRGRQVVELAGPRMPADHGLASLGLLMQLGGALFLAFNVMLALTPLLSGAGGAGEATFWMFAIGATGAVRSAFHRSAGAALAHGSPSGAFKPTQVYIAVSGAQTAITMLALSKLFHGAEIPLSPYLLMLAAWPATLAIVISRPRMRRLIGDSLPVAEDRGYEGAAVLMTLFGVTGAVASAFIVLAILDAGGSVLSTPYGFLSFAVIAMLLVRSIIHAHAGISGVRGISDPDQFSINAARYYNFGVVSSVIAAGALFIMFMMTAFEPRLLVPVGLMAYCLLAWPLALRRFFVERNFSAYLAGEEAPTFHRAPDGGLTALGWLLLSQSVLALAGSLPGLWMEGSTRELLSSGLPMLGVAQGTGSVWLSIGIAVLQLWAAIELVLMSERSRVAASLYGLGGTIVTLYIYWPFIKDLRHAGLGRMGGSDSGPFGALPMLAVVTLALVVPLATLLLSNRPPTPQARVVERA